MFDLLFPRQCLGCGKSGQYFCSQCIQLIKVPKMPVCPQCLEGSLLGATHARCLRPLSLDGLVSVCRYEDIVKKAIKKLKYKFVTDLAEELVSQATGMIEEKQGRFFPSFDSNWALTPIPLHPRRQRWRGFNQAELLGEMMAKKMGWRFCPDLLIRHKFTKPQTKVKEKKKRRANIRWAFKVNPDSRFSGFAENPRFHRDTVHDSRVILFDDVWTTGATIKECAQVLKRRKVRKVWGLTLAR
jgi:ComF family protein